MPRLQLVILLAVSAALAGEDAFRVVPLAELSIEGAWPDPVDDPRSWLLAAEREPYAVLDGPGEAVVGWDQEDWRGRDATSLRTSARLSVRAPLGTAATGVLAIPHGDGMALL